MRAAVITGHGGLDVLQIADLPEPGLPGAGMVRIRVGAVALNRLDIWVREGWPGLKLAMPHVTSSDAAGTVEAIGEGVTNVAPGDRVGINPTLIDPALLLAAGSERELLDSPIMGEHVPGAAAEIINVPARNLIRLPDDITFAQSAAAGLVYITAWHSLIVRGGLQAGEQVLVIGAGGGVNTASIQIAKLAGCTVIVVGSSPQKCEQALSLGADHAIDRSADDAWAKAVYRLTGKRGVDVVVDNVGQATIGDSLRAVRRGGRVLIVGNTSGPLAQIDLRYLFGKHISLIGSSMGTTQDFHRVMGLVFAGSLKPMIGAELPIESIRRGHELLEGGELFGKVVLRF
jgi:NADPH:quinone reductase-like Zn-dependent oxidoreductase